MHCCVARVTFIPENGFGRAGVDGEPERGGPPSVGKPGDLQLGFAIGAGVLEHLICGRRADRPTFRDSHELLAKLSKALLSRKIIWFRVPITLIRVRLFTSKFNRIFLVSTHLSKPQKHYSHRDKAKYPPYYTEGVGAVSWIVLFFSCRAIPRARSGVEGTSDRDPAQATAVGDDR